MKIFVTRKIPQVGIDLLQKEGFEVSVSPLDRPLSHDELLHEVSGVEAILSK